MTEMHAIAIADDQWDLTPYRPSVERRLEALQFIVDNGLDRTLPGHVQSATAFLIKTGYLRPRGGYKH